MSSSLIASFSLVFLACAAFKLASLSAFAFKLVLLFLYSPLALPV
jgi:hypothetical protein